MDKYILVQHLTSLGTVVTDTFKSTQRIKLTSFDISDHYIVFGASSGGIYIFKREPCEFLKLIPSKEGPAAKIAIALNEKNLAIASPKGLIVILENFLDVTLSPLLHCEHEGNNVTAIKWLGNILYCGDSAGKISLFSLGTILTMFQTPPAALMQLDSCIVQLDTYLHYLLISTRTRTYLCDTEKELYKQIGKKLREGNFGACFFNTGNDMVKTYNGSEGIYKTIHNGENFSTTLIGDVKIYCARPGARLWEANFEPTVLITHQFRASLAQHPSDLLQVANESDARLNIIALKDVNGVDKSFNFGAIYPVSSRFIVTYDAEGLYFFDPQISSLVFWSRCRQVRDIKVLNSVIYIWKDDFQVNVFSVELLEHLIIKSLLSKQYYLCADFCATFSEDVINLIGRSKKMNLISILKNKLVDAPELLEKIAPVLSVLVEYNKKLNLGTKLSASIKTINNRIVLVDNIHSPNTVEHGNESVFENISNETETLTNSFTDNSECAKSALNNNMLSLSKQYKLNKTHKKAELTESSGLLDRLDLDDVLALFNDFVEYVDTSERDIATLWCKEQLLKQASRKQFDLKVLKRDTSQFLTDTFLELNKSSEVRCKCRFPLPKACKEPLEYFALGCTLLDELENESNYLDNIPFLYKYKLGKLNNLNSIRANLPLIMQFSDKDLLRQYGLILTYDSWDEIIRLFINIKRGVCLNCAARIDTEGLWTWTELGMLIIGSIGAQNAARLLRRYVQHIPNGELDVRFYQCSILATSLDQPGLAVNFMDKVVADDTKPEFDELMTRFLQRNYLGSRQHATASDVTDDVDQKCAYCDLPLKAAILFDIRKCACGHDFHSVCFSRNGNICNVCTTT